MASSKSNDWMRLSIRKSQKNIYYYLLIFRNLKINQGRSYLSYPLPPKKELLVFFIYNNRMLNI